MKLIENDIRSIDLTDQPNGDYYLALIVSGDAHASILNRTITGIIKLSYDYLHGMSVLLSIENVT